jgi:hypothetical protein
MVKKYRNYAIAAAAVLGLILACWLYQGITSSHIEIDTDDTIGLTPTQIESIEDIGEWEFLSVSDEELIDTVRKGFLHTDQLARIYYGTLRLGINMRQARPGWVRQEGDTLYVILPPVTLLDENFIDEARTKSFFEEGSWSQKDRQKLYYKAHAVMKRRCLTKKNYETAKQNAVEQFGKLLRAMGFEKVRIENEL